MNKIQNDKFSQSEKILEELKKIILNLDTTSILMEISNRHGLKKEDQNVFVQHCNKYLYSFNSHTHGFIRSLEAHNNIGKKAKVFAKDFKEGVLISIKESLKDYNINIDEDVENVFYKSKNLKLTDKSIYYSENSLNNPPLPIGQISNIRMHNNLLQTNYTVVFEVFIPEKGRWGTVDRPGISFRTKKEASAFIGILEKAIEWGNFRLMYENIENYY